MKRFLLLSFLFLITGIAAFAQPANDACAGAQSTTPDGSCYSGTTVGANDNWIGTVGCQSGNHPEVWYSFVATGSQLTYSITAGTIGNNIELVVVSSTAACTGLVIQGSACGPSPLTGTMQGLQVGTTYYYTISTSGAQGTFTTCMTTASPPPVAGQDCPTASILCTSNQFSQASSSAGFGTQELNTTNSCWGSGGERQSKWYKFTIGCSGTLGFVITPNVLTDDYDWCLYNVTANPSTCGLTLTSATVPVACNWSGCTGATGLDPAPNSVTGVTLCGGPPGPCGGGTYARAFCNETAGNMNILNVTAGQVYALLIDNYTTSNNGFSFRFTGTATIGPNAGFTLTSTNCGQNVTATKTCGTAANFNYFWNFGDGFTSTSAGPISHTYAVTGSYIVTLTVTDPLGCTDVFSQTVAGSNVSSTTSVTNIACNGGTTGAVDLTPTSGTGPYTYTWSNSATTQDLNNVGAGTYTVTINDAGTGCTGTATATVTQPPAITATPSQTNLTCSSTCNGTASVVAAGGNGTYTYNWSPAPGGGQGTANATGLCAGNYTCTISSPAGCTFNQTFSITAPPAVTATSSQTNVTCNGSCNGSASVVASGGTGTYTYNWSPAPGGGQGTANATGLCAQNYTCTISSPAGCNTTQTFSITQPPAITATNSQTNVTCNGSCNGTASVVASGGTGTYTYNWSPAPGGGQGTANATGLCAQNYTCTISSPAGCSITQSFAITQPPAITATASQTNVTCNGSCNGTASVVAAGGTGTYTYNWSPAPGGGQGTANATGLCAQNYTCTISSPAGCSITQSFAITQPPAITATTSQTNLTCNAVCNGTASVVASGGTGTYTYNWSPAPGGGQGTANATGLCAQNYTCTISSPAGCNITQSFAITQPPAITATASQTNISCNASCNGTASVVAAGGTGTYTYNWSPAPGGGQGTANATGLCAQSYTCTISSPAGCSITQSFTITQPPALTVTSSQTNITCNAACNGTATVTPTGGTGSYTYNWTPAPGAGQGTANATGLCPGNYTCTITDANACTTTQTFLITQPPAITATASQTNLTCNAICNGTASVNASGGTGTYTYLWAPTGGTAATAPNLCAGNYTCTISSPAGCSITQTFSITQPPALAGSTTSTAATCGGNNGTITANISGGTGGYTYSWSTIPVQTSSTATGLPAGSYTCTISDANGCSFQVSGTINNTGGPTATLSSSGNVSCFGGTNGTATGNATGGTTPYTFSWNSAPVQTTQTATGLPAGSYTCTVTDASGCISTTTVTITEPTQLTATVSTTPANCGGNNGSATVTPSGGVSGYTYSWSSGGSAATESGLASGNYTCTITDANGCTTTATVNIANSSGPAASIASSGNISCFGGSTGTATASASGGTSPYSYAWSSGGTNATENGLAAGTYTVVITDANGCADSTTVILTQPTQLTASVTATIDANCGASDGSAMVTASGGISAYSYSWSSGGTAATENGLAAGSYTCTITDANGCTTTATALINNLNGPTAQIASSSNNLCFGDNTGTAVATASGGVGPYNFAWSPVGGTNDTATGLPSGSYTCTITDANGCLSTTTVTLTQPTALNITASSTPATCSANNGTATAVVSGGTPNYSYSWSSGGNAATENNLAAGSYTVTLTDINGCTATQSVTVTQTSGLTATTSTSGVSCFGGTNGTATATPTSGTSPFTYAWSSGGTGATENGLPAGNYTVTITDSTGCSTTQTVTVTQPTQLSATSTFTNATCFGSNNGTGSVTPSGGTGTYTYSWSPAGGNNQTANNLPPGSYTCTITDANGCTTTQAITVSEPPQITSTATSSGVSCNGGTNGSASVNASGGTGTLSYNWSPAPGGGQGTASATGMGAGTYTCTITDANGCTSTQTVAVTQPTALSLSVSVGSDCAGMPTPLTANPSGGVGPYTYLWSNGATTASQTVTLTTTTTFSVTITDANGCTTTASGTPVILPTPVAAFTTNAQNGFFDISNGDLCITDNSTGATSWTWDLNGTLNTTQSPCVTLTLADSGTYCVSLIAASASGCADTVNDCFEIGQTAFLIPNVFTPNADGMNDVFFITNSGMMDLRCEIYDRWGVLIYKWDGTTGGWDGRNTSGNEVADGVYYFVVYMTDFSNKEVVEHGFVQLIRGK